MNPSQLDLADRFRSGVLESIKAYDAMHDAVCITTPFTDFIGEPLHIYATKDGQISDGGSTLNQFNALRCYRDYVNWPFREEFLEQRGIREETGELLCVHLTPCGVLRYAQGLAELQTKFEAHPLGGDEE